MPIHEFECRRKAHRSFSKMNDKPPSKCRKPAETGKTGFGVGDTIQGFRLVCNRLRGQEQESGRKAEKDGAAATASSDDKKSDKSDKKTKESSPAKKTSETASTTKVPSGD
jgi:hypothetical protein